MYVCVLSIIVRERYQEAALDDDVARKVDGEAPKPYFKQYTSNEAHRRAQNL